MAEAPSLSQEALTASEWSADLQAVQTLISHGLQFQQDAAKLADAITPEAIEIPLDALNEALSQLPKDFYTLDLKRPVR